MKRIIKCVYIVTALAAFALLLAGCEKNETPLSDNSDTAHSETALETVTDTETTFAETEVTGTEQTETGETTETLTEASNEETTSETDSDKIVLPIRPIKSI